MEFLNLEFLRKEMRDAQGPSLVIGWGFETEVSEVQHTVEPRRSTSAPCGLRLLRAGGVACLTRPSMIRQESRSLECKEESRFGLYSRARPLRSDEWISTREETLYR